MGLIPTFGGTLTFSGNDTSGTGVTVKVRSVTMNWERASLDVTTISDFWEQRTPGRMRRFGSLTIFRQDTNIDKPLMSHLHPHNLSAAISAQLTLKYVEVSANNTATAANVLPGTYGRIGSNQPAMFVHITSASFTDDGTGAGTWELSWEEQGTQVVP
jgi:hypothetical protein